MPKSHELSHFSIFLSSLLSTPYPIFPYSFLFVWEAALYDNDTVVWAVKPQLKQTGNVSHVLRK